MTTGLTQPETSRGSDKQLDADARMVRRLLGYISMSDKHEEARRKTDRIGGNLRYGKHWNVQVAAQRAALTVNVASALIDHKISIMTKQQPVPVIEATDVGDNESARLMRSCVMQWWERDDMQAKVERAVLLANCTRSSAIKFLWDPTLYDGAGDVTGDVLPGWKLIVDPRASQGERMQFCGDRAMLPRARAMLLYPKAAKKIEKAPSVSEQGPSANASGTGTPIRDPWQKLHLDFPTTAIVNGTPTLLSYTGNVPGVNAASDLVQICELHIRDYSMYKATVKKKDEHGRPVQKVKTDESGMPQFTPAEHTHHTAPDGTPFSIPNYELVMEDVYEEVRKRVYSFWRRITLLLPDAEIIEDVAWDYPLPYSFFHDGDSLEGFWVKGSLLDLESLQGALNVSLSTMLDNLRFSAYRAYIAYSGSMLERNTMNLAPGEILRAGEKGTLEPMPVAELSQAWMPWVTFIIGLMEKLIGATGIMQGEAAGRVDSAAGYDLLAEIGGSTLVKCTQLMERSIADGIGIVGKFMQEHYDEKHAVAVEDLEGNITFERITPGSLRGSFSYKVLTGSSMAWSESAVRARVLEELNQGLRDKVSAWKALHIEDYRSIMARMLQLPPQLQPAPPPRTRQQLPPKPKTPKNGQAVAR
jgi:hypothetical protein